MRVELAFQPHPRRNRQSRVEEVGTPEFGKSSSGRERALDLLEPYMKGGKAVYTAHSKIANDGKSLSVSSKGLNPLGQTVDATTVIYAMSDKLIVKADVDETDIGRIRLGMPATITLDSYPAQPIPGAVFQILHEGIH